MNARQMSAACLVLALLPIAGGARGFSGGGGGGFRGGGGGDFSRGGGGGGFDFHNDAPASHPQSFDHSSTGPAGTSHSTTATNTGNGYNRTTTSSNGNYNRTSSGSASNGQYNHSSSASNGYANRSGSTSANANTGNYSHNGSGSNGTGSYNTNTNGNAYNHTSSTNTNASNVYGQSYHGGTYTNNGYAYHGAYGNPGYYGNYHYVANPVYGSYGAWGWNGGVAWDAAPYYWGGGFWGAYAAGVASAVAWGSVVNASNQAVYSYQVQANSPGAKLLSSYNLTQTQCGPPDLVVIYGPNNSLICAQPNNLVSAGTYTVDSSNLTIVSYNPSASQ
jgi:hypothetical protein